MKIGIGIDTGGTYTDAVIYDFTNKTILGSAKALTTKYDLSIGILGALDKLPGELLRSAELISLSTTLATNACVEDKGGNAKLIFFGGDKKVIDEAGGKYGLPPAGDIYIQESYTTFSGEIEREPDWQLFKSNIDGGTFNHYDGIGIIEMNAMKNGAVVEKTARRLLQENYDAPVVCGHELFSGLNCLQRGSSTLLNARLFPVIKEFLDAVKTAVTERGINASAVIVRSDGSLMSEEFASLRPVETLLCGPAASAIGGTKLSDSKNSIIIDMGGTTTDIAIVENNIPVKTVGGVSIGKWKTFVNGLYVKTFGLGGDSAIHYEDGKLRLEEYRIIPVCVAASQYPSMLDNLKDFDNNGGNKHTMYLYEHYMLIKDIEHNERYTQEEKAFCRAIKAAPLMLREAAAAVSRDIYTLNVSRLLKEGVVQMCGLTPTDIMHIKGDFNVYSAEASRLAAKFPAMNLNVSVETLCGLVYDEIKRKIYLNVVKAMLENKYDRYMRDGINADVEYFINESYQTAKNGRADDFITMTFDTGFKLIGIGAPVHIFLKDVAEMLGTKAIIPQHAEVANALGAIIGNVHASYSVEIKPVGSAGGIIGYTVFGNNGNISFEHLDEAERFAISEAKAGAEAEAIRRGAKGEITVTCTLAANEAAGRNSAVHLNTIAVAHAIGAIGFN